VKDCSFRVRLRDSFS